MTTTKLPTSDRPLIQDPDLAKALEKKLEPLSGKALERAQAAIRKVRASPVQGPFSHILETYLAAVDDAVASVKGG